MKTQLVRIGWIILSISGLSHCSVPQLEQGNGLRWIKSFPELGSGYFSDAVFSREGEVFIAGSVSGADGQKRATVFKTNSGAGLSLWSESTEEKAGRLGRIFATEADELVLTSIRSNSGGKRIRIARINSERVVEETVETEALKDMSVWASHETVNGAIAFLVSFHDDTSEKTSYLIYEWGSKGNPGQFRKVRIPNRKNILYKDFVSSDEGYILVGASDEGIRSEKPSQIVLTRHNLEGALVGSHAIGEGRPFQLLGNLETGFWVFGHSSRASIWHVSASGERLSFQTYDCDSFEVVAPIGNDFLVTGPIHRKEIFTDACLYRIDRAGEIRWNRKMVTPDRSLGAHLSWMLPENSGKGFMAGGLVEVEKNQFLPFSLAVSFD
jgi:hypothetical protein